MILQDATSADLDEVLAATHPLWGDGLDERSYKEYVATLMGSAWGRRGYRFLAYRAQAGGPIVAAMKLYRLAARLGGRSVSVGGVGAVFTMPQARRQGHAAAMLGQAHELMRRRGDALSLLFSEIGPDYYAELGYRKLPCRAVMLKVPEAPLPVTGVERMRKAEIPRLSELRACEDHKQPVVLERDGDYWQYQMARHSMPTLWLGPQRWESRITMRGGEGYLWVLFREDASGMRARILEHAEVSPGAALPALLGEHFAECARRGISRVEASAGDGESAPAGAIPMWRVLDDSMEAAARAAEPAVRFHLTDVF